jgi:ABC-2 type transport system permease protein
MIGTVVRIGFVNLRRDRVAQVLTFVLPVAFFSIFVAIFSSQGEGSMPPVTLALVDEDGTEGSRKLAAALEAEDALKIVRTDKAGKPFDRGTAEGLVRDGKFPLAVVLPKGLGSGIGLFGGDRPKVVLLSDPADPIAHRIVQGLLQKAGLLAAPDLLISNGVGAFERYVGPLTREQHETLDRLLPRVGAGGLGVGGGGDLGIVPTEVVDVIRKKNPTPIVAFYAAGLGVMFLLFSCSAAGGSLLDELESGTLDRLLSSPLGMGGLLVGKWIFLLAMGVLQITVMFVWGALVFGLSLLPHLAGFVVMTLATSSAAAAFGLLLATISRSRAQLGGLSSIIILLMSSLGGSMFPRYMMSEQMQKVGLLTFNAWALDGYVKVFWRSAPLLELWPQVLVLALLTVAFFAAARLFAWRWEQV